MIINANANNTTTNRLVLLWQNPLSTSSTFTSKTVALDLKPYRIVYIVYSVSTTERSLSTCSMLIDPIDPSFECSAYLTAFYSNTECYRQCTVTKDGIEFASNSYVTGNTMGTDNKYAIPFRIYGCY